MYRADIVVLNWLSQQRQWPPKFPRTETLLTPLDDSKIPRDEWGTAEWQAYAMFLEESGKNIMRELNRLDADLKDSRRKLSRSNPNSRRKQRASTVNMLGDREQKIYGRKSDGKTKFIAAEAIDVRIELEATGQKMTDLAAIQELRARKGMRPSRPKALRNIRNMMSKYRRSHNISTR
jgi:hypothetical protein